MKALLITFLFLSTYTSFGQGANEYQAAEKKNKALEKQMQQQLTSTLEKLTPEQKKLVSVDQEAWTKYTDSQLALEAYELRKVNGSGLTVLNKRNRLTQQRIQYLKDRPSILNPKEIDESKRVNLKDQKIVIEIDGKQRLQ